MIDTLQPNEVFGIVRPAVDAHTLGISYVAELLHEAHIRVVVADDDISRVLTAAPPRPESLERFREWLGAHGITRLGFSYRLDPGQAQLLFGRFFWQIRNGGLLTSAGGPIRAVYFAGLPEACKGIGREYQGEVGVFPGDETAAETLARIGVPLDRIPPELHTQSAYDDLRMAFGRALISEGRYWDLPSIDRSGYPEYGTRGDTVLRRLDHATCAAGLPLLRAHVGPYLPDAGEAIDLFCDWVRQLRDDRQLDVLSIGTSQLTQSHFGEDWRDLPNGGGVPIASEADYRRVYEAARPMLVRTYAGTRNVPALARIHEDSLNIAWHALSFWWFCRIDGRGPNTLIENLREHLETLDFIAATGKPLEPNVPHHFSFRGGDDVTYVVSAYLAACAAKSRGVPCLILQNMLNTPRHTRGLQDLAKSRAMLRLVRGLEDASFRVILQARAGLDYFSSNLDTARAQLAAVTALMDDIEPDNPNSPPMVHVVSHSEGSHLADPPVVTESLRIVRAALEAYRQQRRQGAGLDRDSAAEVAHRTEELYQEARQLLDVVHRSVSRPYTAEGLYSIFAAGFLPVPRLSQCREEFPKAVAWQTKVLDGAVKVIGTDGKPIPARLRAEEAAQGVSQGRVAAGQGMRTSS